MCLQWPSEADKLQLHRPLVSWRFSFPSLCKWKKKREWFSLLFHLSSFLFSPFVSLLFCACLPGSCLGDSYGYACWDIRRASVSKDPVLIEQLLHICFPSCIVISGFIRGMLYTTPYPLHLERLFLPYKCLRLHINVRICGRGRTPQKMIHLYAVLSPGSVLVHRSGIFKWI